MMAEIHDDFRGAERDPSPEDESGTPGAALAGWLIVLILLVTLVAVG